MSHEELTVAAYVVTACFLVLLGLLFINSARLSTARLRIFALEEAQAAWRPTLEERRKELAQVRALREKVAETELFTRLALEMGWTVTGEDDDTVAVGEE